jgi:hypothetical protein
MNERKLIESGMVEAQFIAQTEGLDVGKDISHPTDLRRFRLSGINDEIAEVVIEDHNVCPSKLIEKKNFPFHELFNTDIAIGLGKRLQR